MHVQHTADDNSDLRQDLRMKEERSDEYFTMPKNLLFIFLYVEKLIFFLRLHPPPSPVCVCHKIYFVFDVVDFHLYRNENTSDMENVY